MDKNEIENMWLELESRRSALETRLAEKSKELYEICMREAQLTGVEPPETPNLSPPHNTNKRPIIIPAVDTVLQINKKGRCCELSPRRMRPRCQWLSGGFDTLPARGAEATIVAPAPPATWSSPTKSSRKRPYFVGSLGLNKKL